MLIKRYLFHVFIFVFLGEIGGIVFLLNNNESPPKSIFCRNFLRITY